MKTTSNFKGCPCAKKVMQRAGEESRPQGSQVMADKLEAGLGDSIMAP